MVDLRRVAIDTDITWTDLIQGRGRALEERSSQASGFRCVPVIVLAFALTMLAASGAVAQSESVQNEIVSRYIRALNATDSASRRDAAMGLGNFAGSEGSCRASAKAVPALLRALSDQDVEVRAMTAWALGNIQGDRSTTVPALVATLGDQEVDVRTRAAGALTRFANCSEYTAQDVESTVLLAVPALAAAMRDSSDNVREEAGKSLRTYGSDARISLPSLVELLNDRHVRLLAAKIIAAIGPDAQPAVASLTVMLKDDNEYARLEAAAALANIGANLPQALPIVSRLLAHSDFNIRTRAAFVVGLFGAAALPAIPRLTVALDDHNPDVQRLAIASFRRILEALLEARRTDGIKILRTAAATVERSPDHEVVALGPEIAEVVESLGALQASPAR